MKLNKSINFSIAPTFPFHFDGTFHKPSHFPDKLSDWQPSKYWQAIRIGKRIFGLKIEDKGSNLKPQLLVSVFYNGDITNSDIENIKAEIIWRFGLDEDLTEFNNLAKKVKCLFHIFQVFSLNPFTIKFTEEARAVSCYFFCK